MHSSADAVLLSASTVTVRDLVPRLGRRSPVAAARALTPLYAALGLLAALVLDRNVLETLKLGYSIFAAGLILPVLAALWLPARSGVPTAGAIAAMIAGGSVAAIGRFRPEIAFGVDPVLSGTAVNLAVLVAAWALRRRADRTSAS
jgi:Na+/pantothenate symporter